MLHVPSWKWLSFRPTREIVSGDAAPASRPCLPAVEQLDDRLMLSASTDASEVPPPNGDTQILIGLLRGQIGVLSDELNAIKFAGALKLDVHKFTESFQRIDDLINKVGEAQIKVDLTDHKIQSAISDLKVEFLKIDALVGGIDSESGGSLKFVLDSLEHKATELVGLLSSATGGGDLDHKIELKYQKVADSFLALDGALLKIQEDAALARKAGKGQQEYLEVKLREVLVSSLKIDDIKLQDELAGLKIDTLRLLQPDSDFTGGVTTDGSTGDVLA
jgi:hypothetical protein